MPTSMPMLLLRFPNGMVQGNYGNLTRYKNSGTENWDWPLFLE